MRRQATPPAAWGDRFTVVGLFRAPATNRWRYAFSTASAERSGLTLGAHACAISVQAGEPIGQPIKVVRSAAVTCP